jgi:hypothetical protein
MLLECAVEFHKNNKTASNADKTTKKSGIFDIRRASQIINPVKYSFHHR